PQVLSQSQPARTSSSAAEAACGGIVPVAGATIPQASRWGGGAERHTAGPSRKVDRMPSAVMGGGKRAARAVSRPASVAPPEVGPVADMPLLGSDHRWSDPQAALVPPQGIDQEQGALLDDLGRRRVDVLRIRLGAAGQLRQMDRVGLLPDQERPDVAGGLAQI